MFKHCLLYFALSILLVVFSKYAHLFIVYIDQFFYIVNLKLSPIFSHTGWGLVIRKILVLMLLPLIIVGVPALIYRAIKKREMPYFIAIIWIIWTIIVLSDILIR